MQYYMNGQVIYEYLLFALLIQNQFKYLQDYKHESPKQNVEKSRTHVSQTIDVVVSKSVKIRIDRWVIIVIEIEDPSFYHSWG